MARCHVRWTDGEASVELPTLRLLDGDPLPPSARRLLRDRITQLSAAWNALNPRRPIG